MNNKEIKSTLVNTIGIDPNKNNVSIFSVDSNSEVSSYYEEFQEIEKTEVNKSIKNKKKRIKYFYTKMEEMFKKDFISIYNERKSINEMGYEFNPIFILHSIWVKKELPNIKLEIGNVKYSSSEVCFFIISNYFFNHRGLKTKRTKIKIDNETKDIIKLLGKVSDNNAEILSGSLKNEILKIPKNFDKKNIHNNIRVRKSFCNKLLHGDDVFFMKMSDNITLYEELLEFLKIDKVKEVSENLFWVKNQNGKKCDKRGKCSFLKEETRGDKIHPYQEIITAHIKLNISNIDLNGDVKEFNKKFIANIKKGTGFISHILINILKFSPKLNKDKFILTKGKKTYSILDIVDIYENIEKRIEKNKEFKNIKNVTFTEDELNAIYEYYEESNSNISSTSNIYAKLYTHNLFNKGIVTTTNMLNLISINEYYNGTFESDINDMKLIHDGDLYKKLNINQESEIDIILKKDFNFKNSQTRIKIKKEIDFYIDSILKKKWTDPNVIQKINIFAKKLFNDFIWDKNGETLKENLQNLRNFKIIIESTKEKLDNRKKEDIILRSIYGQILNDVCGKRKINKLLFETNNIDIYDGKSIYDDDESLEVDHIVPQSISNIYGNSYENTIVTKGHLNSTKNDELPLSSNLPLEFTSFKRMVNDVYSTSVERMCKAIKEYIEKNDSIYVGLSEEYAIQSDLFLYKSNSKGGWTKTKSNITDYLTKYFKEKKNILLLQESKDSIECEFDSKTLSNISHTTMAFRDVLIDLFGIPENKIEVTPRKFNYIGQIRKIINRKKDRNFKEHHIEDCVLLSFLNKRNTKGRKSVLNDNQDLFNYFKSVHNIDLKDESDIEGLNTYLDKVASEVNFNYKKIRKFEKKTINGKKIITPRKKFHEETVRSCTIKGGKTVREVISETTFFTNNGEYLSFGKKGSKNLKIIQKENGVYIAYYKPSKKDEENVEIREKESGNFISYYKFDNTKPVFFDNINNIQVVKKEEKVDTLYKYGKPNKYGKYQAKNKSREALNCLTIDSDDNYKLLNIFEKNIDTTNFKVRKGDIYNIIDLTILDNTIKGKFIIKAINSGEVKLTNVNTNLSINETAKISDKKPYLYKDQLKNNIAFKLSYKEFKNAIDKENIEPYYM